MSKAIFSTPISVWLIAFVILLGAVLFASEVGGIVGETLYPYRNVVLIHLVIGMFIPLSRLLGVSFNVLGVILGVAGHLFLGSLDIGPVSFRIYVMLLLAFLLAADTLTLRRKLFRSALARDLAMIYLGFIVWTMLAKQAHGTPFRESVFFVMSNHLFALVSFIVIQNRLVTQRHIVLFAGALAFAAILSALFAAGQWFGIEIAWDIALALRPGGEESLLGTRFGSFGFVPGLSLFSISLSYLLITLGFFVYSWTIHRQRIRPSHLLLGVMISGVIALGIILSQSRSAIGATAIVVLGCVDIWCIMDTCQRLNYAMNNGRKSLNFCAHAQTSTLERRTIAGATSRPSCGWHEVVLLGDCCLSTTVTGTAYISASHAGVKRVYGNECISILCKTPIWSMSSLIAL